MAESAPVDSSSALLRDRLHALEERLRSAGRHSDKDGFTSVSVHLAECADEIRTILGRPSSPRSFVMESLIARAEHALDVWRSLSEF